MSTAGLPLEAEDFRALARSSPWLFTTLHWRHWQIVPGRGELACEAWLQRPGRLTVAEERDVIVEEGRPSSPGSGVPAHTVEPTRRSDGLVIDRPSEFEVDYDDPMYRNFFWVAMLDPVELATGVELRDVHEAELRGRATWWATCTTTPDYESRCPRCCDLLFSDEVAARGVEEGRLRSSDDRRRGLPSRFVVGLDRQTGVVAEIAALDGTAPGLLLSNEILSADEPLTPPAPAES